MAKSLNTPITIQNVTRWKVLAATPNKDNLDDSGNPNPYVCVTVQFMSPSGVTYGLFKLKAYDNQDSDYVYANPAAMSSYMDRLLRGTRTIASAYTTIQAANDSAGNRNAQLLAVEAALLTTTMVDASLAGT